MLAPSGSQAAMDVVARSFCEYTPPGALRRVARQAARETPKKLSDDRATSRQWPPQSLELSARYANAKIAVNPSSGFFLSFSIMELVSRG
jgi:hypothetical protein